jgi:hypothetical protein
MTSGFEQQGPLGNTAFTKPVARPQQVGVQLPRAPKTTDQSPPARPAERKTF